MTHPVIHNDFTIERTYPQSAAKVWRGFSDATRKRRWFAEGEGFVVDGYELDFRIGGFERCRFRPTGGPPMTNDCLYLDIVDHERLVFAYSMTFDGAPMSASLTTIELTPAPGKAGSTLLRFSEHTTYLDGNDGSAGRREGSLALLASLAGELANHE
jgi:uncharacterized protein YndB with AHSA1/START domain